MGAMHFFLRCWPLVLTVDLLVQMCETEALKTLSVNPLSSV